MPSQIPVLRILGALFFILAGLAYYFGVPIASSGSLVFVAAGVAVVLLALAGHRANGGDIAIFVIGLLVLAVFVSPGIGMGTSTAERVSHTLAKTALTIQLIDVVALTDVGSISVFYSANGNLGYQVNFTRSAFPFGVFGGSMPSTSLTNETTGGAFVLNATAHSYDISIAIGTGYSVNITANAGTGSINVRGLAGEKLGTVSLDSGTGSVTADLSSQSIGGVGLQTGTGSINVDSSHLAPDGARVPIKLHAGTGSVNLNVKFAKGTAVSLEASAGLGSVNQNLQGFTISPQSTRSYLTAQAGDVSGAVNSFIVQASAGTGSVNLGAQFLG